MYKNRPNSKIQHRSIFTMHNVILSIVFWSFLALFITKPVYASTTFDMANTENWNIRFDGANANDNLGRVVVYKDLNGDAKPDLVIGAPGASYNSRTNSGSVYVIYNSLLNLLSGKGNTIDLNNPSNFNIRYDLPPNGNTIASQLGINIANINDSGKPDLIINDSQMSTQTRSMNGSVFLIFNELITAYTGTGNVVDLNNSNNFNIRYDGAANTDQLGFHDPAAVDINGDQKTDLLLGARTLIDGVMAGSVYLIYNQTIKLNTGVGKIVDLATLENFNIRFDGESTPPLYNNSLGFNASIVVSDLNADGFMDLALADYNDNNNGLNSGSIYIFYNSSFIHYSGTGNLVRVDNPDNWNVRIDGGTIYDENFGVKFGVGDIYGTGKKDIIVNNAKKLMWIVPYSIYGAYQGTGQYFNTTDTTKYSLKIDGTSSVANPFNAIAVDYFSTGKVDILLEMTTSDPNSRADSGSVYILSNALVRSYTGTGNSLDLSTSSNYTFRYDGAAASDQIKKPLSLFDLNSDASPDLIISAITDNNSRTNSGSVYIIYNFPHTITINYSGKDRISGTVSAPNSVTSIAGVQFNYNNNDPASTEWKTCTGTTTFTCILSAFPTGSNNRIYIRAVDTNGSYTPQASYAIIDFIDEVNKSSGPVNPNCLPNFTFCITSGPHFLGSNTFQTDHGMSFFASNTAHHDDLFTQLFKRPWNYLQSITPKIPFPWEQGLDTVSDLFEIQVRSAFNGFPIFTLDYPATVVLPFDPSKQVNPTFLRIGYFDTITEHGNTYQTMRLSTG